MLFDSSSLRFRSSAGFSLAEVLIAIVIITILTIGSLAVYSAQLGRARDTERTNDISRIKLLLDQFVAQYGVPPGSGADKARRLKKNECKTDNTLFECFDALQFSTTEDLKEMLLDPSDGIQIAGATGPYGYKYSSSENSYVICATLEDQNASIINSDKDGKDVLGTTADNMYCLRYIAPGDATALSPAELIVVP